MMRVTESPGDDPLMVPRQLRPGQRTEVWIVDVDRAAACCVYTADTVLLEAPNWAADGGGLLLNGDGLLWRLDLDLEPEIELSVVPIENLPPINNDHVLDPDGTAIFMSAMDGQIYRGALAEKSATNAAIAVTADHVLDPPRRLIYLSANDGHIYVPPERGGAARLVTHDRSRYHFLHGVSPDGRTLAFVDLPRAQFSVPGRLALVVKRRDRGGGRSATHRGGRRTAARRGTGRAPAAPGSLATAAGRPRRRAVASSMRRRRPRRGAQRSLRSRCARAQVVVAHLDRRRGHTPAYLCTATLSCCSKGRHRLVGVDPPGPVGLVQHGAVEAHTWPAQRRVGGLEPFVLHAVRGEDVRDQGRRGPVAVVDTAGDRQ